MRNARPSPGAQFSYRLRLLKFALTGVACIVWPACDGSANKELMAKLDESGNRLLECKKQNNELTNEVKSLKRQIAMAMANPDKLVLKDPEIIELIADLRGGSQDGDVALGKGDLNPGVASKIVMEGARALQQCYERALKKNASLQMRAGVQLVLGLNVDGTGRVNTVSVAPSIDRGLDECIESSAKRWKFPKFSGQAVTIEQKIMLTPKT